VKSRGSNKEKKEEVTAGEPVTRKSLTRQTKTAGEREVKTKGTIKKKKKKKQKKTTPRKKKTQKKKNTTPKHPHFNPNEAGEKTPDQTRIQKKTHHKKQKSLLGGDENAGIVAETIILTKEDVGGRPSRLRRGYINSFNPCHYNGY